MRGLEAEEGKLRESGEAAPSGRPAPLSHQCPPNFERRISGAAQYFHLVCVTCGGRSGPLNGDPLLFDGDFTVLMSQFECSL